MTNWYPRAIEILSSVDDARAVLFRIAAKHPKAVVDACAPLRAAPPVTDCLQLMLAGQKIPAIKLWRSVTGDGLKEAKDACEALLGRQGA